MSEQSCNDGTFDSPVPIYHLLSITYLLMCVVVVVLSAVAALSSLYCIVTHRE